MIQLSEMTDMGIRALMAFFGTIAFAVLFSVPGSLYAACGLCGAAGFFLYDLLVFQGMTSAVATFFGTLLVGLLARYLAVMLRSPSTIFVITGIFPLVPGAGVYWTSYHLVMGDLGSAADSGLAAIKAALAIVLGLAIVFEIPNGVFHLGMKGAGSEGRRRKRSHGDHRKDPQ